MRISFSNYTSLACWLIWGWFLLFSHQAFSQSGPPWPTLRVGLIADPQYCDCPPLYQRHSASALSKMQTATRILNEEQVDLVVSLGDVIDQKIEHFGPIMSVYRQLEMPYFHVLGNHEFYLVPHADKKGIIDSLEMSDYYCSMQIRGWKFILLDGTELGEYALAVHRELEDESRNLWESIEGQENQQIWNGGISQKQLAWLRKELSASESIGQPVLIFCHFPITPVATGSTLWNDREVLDLISSYECVQAYLCGHRHQGGYQVEKGLHLVNMTGMVLTTDSSAFGILNLYPDRMELTGYGRARSRDLPLRKDMLQGAQASLKPSVPIRILRTETPPDSLSYLDPSGQQICRFEFENNSPQQAGTYLKKAWNGHDLEKAIVRVFPLYPTDPKSAPKKIRKRFFGK